MKETSDICPVFHFYSSKSVSDVPQLQLLNGKPKEYGVFPISIKSKVHGKTVLSCDYPYILTYDKGRLLTIYGKTQNRAINKNVFSIRFVGLKVTTQYHFGRVIRKVKSILCISVKT